MATAMAPRRLTAWSAHPSVALLPSPSPCRHRLRPILTLASVPVSVESRRRPLAARAFTTSPLRRRDIEYFQTPATTSPPTSSTPPPPRKRRRWVSTITGLVVGWLFGSAAYRLVVPDVPPEPDSPEDLMRSARIRRGAANLRIVHELLADPAWNDGHHDAYSSFAPADRCKRLTTGPLGSSAGIGAYQHIFHNATTGEVVSVIYFGIATSGWPATVHGGLLATIADEHAARAAMADPALASEAMGVLTANLNLNYRKPVNHDNFYIMRARALRDDELDEKERGKRNRKAWVDVRLETVSGHLCIDGRALFVIPKNVGLGSIPGGF